MSKPETCMEYLKLSKRISNLEKKILTVKKNIEKFALKDFRKRFPNYTIEEIKFSDRNVTLYGKKYLDADNIDFLTAQYLILEDRVILGISIIDTNYNDSREVKRYV